MAGFLQVQGAQPLFGVGLRPHNNQPIGAEDLNKAQADKIKDGGGLAAVVLNRRYGEKGAIKSNLEWMARTTASQNVDRCSAQELDAISDIPEIADLAANGDPRHRKVREDAITEFLRLKKQKQVDRQGVNWHFRLPEITLQKCPHLDSFDPASGAKFYNWRHLTLKQLDRHKATSAHRLELTKTLLDKKYLFLVSHCQDAEEIFDILEQKIPPKSEICRHLEDRIALGGQALGKEATEMNLYKKAESVQVLLSQLGLVESDFDISKATVDSCLLSFGTGAGSHMEQARLTSAWYEAKRSSNQFMSFSLDVWLETFKSALSGASATRIRAERLTLVDAAVKSATTKQGRQESKQGQQDSKQQKAFVSQKVGMPPSAPQGPTRSAAPVHLKTEERSAGQKTQPKTMRTCFVCSKPGEECKNLALCTCVASWREKKVSMPANRCVLCLHVKDGDQHKYTSSPDTKACHWVSFKNDTRNYCCKHKVSKYLCAECFEAPKKRKGPVSSQKRLSMKQVVSTQKQTSSLQHQTSTPVLLPSIFQLREKVMVCSRNGQKQQVLLIYDSGADHSMASPGLASCNTSEEDRVARNVMIIGSVASKACDLPIIQLDIETKNEDVSVLSINVAVKEMSEEQIDPELPVFIGQNENLKDSISEKDLSLPIIVLGLDNIRWHPTLWEGKGASQMPGLVYFASKLTNKILPVGRIVDIQSAIHEDQQLTEERRTQSTKEARQEVKEEGSRATVAAKEECSRATVVAKEESSRATMGEAKKKGSKENSSIMVKSEQEVSNETEYEGNFCSPLSSLPAVKALAHDLLMTEIRQTWGPVEQSAAISNVSSLGCMTCSPLPQALLDKQDISFF